MNTKNPMFVAVVAFIGALALVFIVDKLYTKKITQNVIQELKRSYAPGPYQPGFDPDKISPQPQPQQSQQPQFQQPQFQGQQVPYYNSLPTPNQWNQQWEQGRL